MTQLRATPLTSVAPSSLFKAFYVCAPLPAKPAHLTNSTSPHCSLFISHVRVLPLSFLLPGLKGEGQGRKGTHGNEKPQCSLVAFEAKKLMALEISSYSWLALYTDGKWGNYMPGWVEGSVWSNVLSRLTVFTKLKTSVWAKVLFKDVSIYRNRK